uniref:DNA-directed DNA polymerase n=1 Tax=Syphacia muris TaxID=451379 RepID=A0A0N5ANG7_9BILA
MCNLLKVPGETIYSKDEDVEFCREDGANKTVLYSQVDSHYCIFVKTIRIKTVETYSNECITQFPGSFLSNSLTTPALQLISSDAFKQIFRLPLPPDIKSFTVPVRQVSTLLCFNVKLGESCFYETVAYMLEVSEPSGPCQRTSALDMIDRSYSENSPSKNLIHCLIGISIAKYNGEALSTCRSTLCITEQLNRVCGHMASARLISLHSYAETLMAAKLLLEAENEYAMGLNDVLLNVFYERPEDWISSRDVAEDLLTVVSYSSNATRCIYLNIQDGKYEIGECYLPKVVVCKKTVNYESSRRSRKRWSLFKLNNVIKKLSLYFACAAGVCSKRYLPRGIAYSQTPFMVSVHSGSKIRYYCVFDIEIASDNPIIKYFNNFDAADMVCNLLFEGHLLSIDSPDEQSIVHRGIFSKVEQQSATLYEDKEFRPLGLYMKEKDIFNAKFIDKTSGTYVAIEGLSNRLSYNVDQHCFALFKNNKIMQISCNHRWQYLACKVQAKHIPRKWNSTKLNKVHSSKLTKISVEAMVPFTTV